MAMFNLRKTSYKGRRFVVIDKSSAIELKSSKKYVPVFILGLLTGAGLLVTYFLLRAKEGISLDLFVAILFWIIVLYLWTKVLNMPVEISIKENKIFFSDYLSNLKYMFIPDVLSVEKKKSMITISSKSDKITFQSEFDGINEFIEELIKINSQIEKRGI
jgi:hypothetical protein